MKSHASVMVIDDDEDIRETVSAVLEEEGYRVGSAANGRDALDQLQVPACRPNVILLDMMMPEMNGWAFREAQLRDPDLASIPIIVFTAYGVPKDTAQQLGAAGFLRKPPELAELLSVVERAHRLRAAG